MPTTLCFDFGNTRLKCAVFKEADIQELLVLPNDEPETIEALLKKYDPQKTILSSVIVHHPQLESLLAAHGSFHLLSHHSQLPFTVPVGKPETVGADRLAYCSAACFFYPKQNNLIIACGSCITYNFINQDHAFLGGGISPGMEIRFKSLQYYTAKLPLVQAEPIVPLIGYDTKTNILSGVVLGMAMEIEGMIAAYAAKFGNFNAILTGGDAAYFVPHLKSRIFADSNLIYKGLYAISELNNS
jgi:type III pantothenate kinase